MVDLRAEQLGVRLLLRSQRVVAVDIDPLAVAGATPEARTGSVRAHARRAVVQQDELQGELLEASLPRREAERGAVPRRVEREEA